MRLLSGLGNETNERIRVGGISMSVHRFILVDANKSEDRYSVLDEFDGVTEDYTYSSLRKAFIASKDKDGYARLRISGAYLQSDDELNTFVQCPFCTDSLDLFVKSIVVEASNARYISKSLEENYTEQLPLRIDIWYAALYSYFSKELSKQEQGVSDRKASLSPAQIKIIRQSLGWIADYTLLVFRVNGFRVMLTIQQVGDDYIRCVDLIKYEPVSQPSTMRVEIPPWITRFRSDAFADLPASVMYVKYSAVNCLSLANMLANTKCGKLYVTIVNLPDTVYDASGMFCNSQADKIAIKGSSFGHITDARCMFRYCYNVQEISFPADEKLETFKYMTIEGMESCFDGCCDLKSIDFGYGLGNKLMPLWDTTPYEAPFYGCYELNCVKVKKAGKWARFLPNNVFVQAKQDTYDGVLLSQYSKVAGQDKFELVQRFQSVHHNEFEFRFEEDTRDVILTRYNGKSKFVAIPRFVSGIATSYERVGEESSPFSSTSQSLYVDTMVFAPAMFALYKGKSIELRTKVAFNASSNADSEDFSLRCLCVNAKNLQSFKFVSNVEVQLASDCRSMFEGCTNLKTLQGSDMEFDIEAYPDCTKIYNEADVEKRRREFGTGSDFESRLYSKLTLTKRYDGMFKDCENLESFRVFSGSHIRHISSWRRAFENCKKLEKIVLTYAVASDFNESTSYEGMLYNCPAKIEPCVGFQIDDLDLSLPDNAYTAPVEGNIVKYEKYKQKLRLLGMQDRSPFILDIDNRLDGVSLVDVMAWSDVDLNGRLDFPEFITDILDRRRGALPKYGRCLGDVLPYEATLTVTWRKCLPVSFVGLAIGDSGFWFNHITTVYDIDVTNIRKLGSTFFMSNTVAKLHHSFTKFGLPEDAEKYMNSGIGECKFELM